MAKQSIRASIDIGTNTVLLLVADTSQGGLTTLYEEQQIPRLGKGVDLKKTLSMESMQRVIDALVHYKGILHSRFPEIESPVITATSAVRDASNRDEFIKLVKESTSWEVRLLSGAEEAEWTYAGALSAFQFRSDEHYMVIDIGGGSTELALGKGSVLKNRHSFDMGSVRFTERYLQGNPPSTEQTKLAEKAINEMYANFPGEITSSNLRAIGVAGTVTSIAYIKEKLQQYDASKINAVELSLDDIESVFVEFAQSSSEEMIEKYPVVMKGRADIFFAGIMILKGFMEVFGFKKLTVSVGGIRHGTLIKTL